MSPKSDSERHIDALIESIRPNPQVAKALEMGLLKVWAYHCTRCNYLWFPRDYDYLGREFQILEMTPPKVCARCKSKYWNEIPQRQTKNYDQAAALPRIRALYRYSLKYYIDRFGGSDELIKAHDEFRARNNPDIKTRGEFYKAFKKEYNIPSWVLDPTFELMVELVSLMKKRKKKLNERT